MNPAWITAGAAFCGTLTAGYLWTTRHIVRDEMAPLREDIEVLRLAVFNHLSHGDQPDEAALRKGLGYDPRRV